MKNDNLIIGINPVKECLKGSREVFELYIQNSASDRRISEIAELAKSKGVKVHRREREDLTKLCNSSHHQGVVLTVAPFNYSDIEDIISKKCDKSIILILDSIQDPHNLGAIIRSASFFGANAVVIAKDRSSSVTATVEKASAGSVETIEIARVVNIAQTIDTLKKENYWVYALDATGDTDLSDAEFADKSVIVVGSEGDGIRPLVLKKCDHIISIKRYGGVNSLNASVAAAVALYKASTKIFAQAR